MLEWGSRRILFQLGCLGYLGFVNVFLVCIARRRENRAALQTTCFLRWFTVVCALQIETKRVPGPPKCSR